MQTKICKKCKIEKQLNNFYCYKEIYVNQCRNCINIKNKIYRNNNKNKIFLKKKKHRDAHKEEIKIKKNIYYIKNKDTIRNKKREHNNKKIINDINYKLHHTISHSIRQSLKAKKCSKNKKSILDYLSYTIEELKIHLQKLFEPWMNWNNWGIYNSKNWNDNNTLTWTWQIDHIIPHSTFKYISMEDRLFKDCWALNNLRPYSAKQNNKDGNKR